MDNDDRKFGVMGVGSVGSSMIHALSRYFDYETYDICDDDPFEQILDRRGGVHLRTHRYGGRWASRLFTCSGMCKHAR